MAWGTNLLNGILGALFGEEESSDNKKKDDAKFGYCRPCGHTNSSKFRYDPLGDDIPEGHYEKESVKSQSSQQNRENDSFNKSSQNSYSQQNSGSQQKKYYKNLIIDQLNYCRQHQDIIVAKANKLYRMVKKKNTSGYLKRRCLNWEELEEILNRFEQK